MFQQTIHLKKGSCMDYFDVAKNIEKQGVAYFQELSAKAPDKALAGIFDFLAQEEQLHYDLFDALQKNTTLPDVNITSNFADAKAGFEKLAAEFALPATLEDYEEAYRKALGLEQRSIELYTGQLQTVTEAAHKNTLQTIIDHEKRHAKTIEGLLEFVRRPKAWLENAEWNHFDSY
ncbi:MAG: hypothetical protein GF398_10050 [Chitinivibrionales bacterium]|nr:hypothetical protein [Chitinivibrionales bacterium]